MAALMVVFERVALDFLSFGAFDAFCATVQDDELACFANRLGL